MTVIRLLVAGLLALGIVTIAAAALAPVAEVPRIPAAKLPSQSVFSEVRRSDLTPGIPENFDYTSPSDLGQRHFLLSGLAPRSYDALPASKPNRPLIVLLHGAGRDGRAMLDMWQGAARAKDVALIAPNMRGGKWTPEDAGPLLAMIADAQARYETDPRRVYLFGHSAGAMIAQLFANYVDGPWRAVATHGGYLKPEMLQRISRGVPVRAYLGTRDALFNPFDAREVAKTLARSGHRSELHLIPDHTHWYYEIGPDLAQEATTWFLRH